MNRFKVAVFIGRFQPFHIGHLDTLEQGLKIADKVVMVLGSYKTGDSFKNPFSFDERVEMIKSAVSQEDAKRIAFVGLKDCYAQGDEEWVTRVNDAVHMFETDDSQIAIIGKDKDASTYYLKYFTNWKYFPSKTKEMSATLVREHIYNGGDASSFVPGGVSKLLEEKYIGTAKQLKHAEEWKMVTNYKKSWAGSPFPPIFVTVDPVVEYRGHILLVRRGDSPGKGKLALPGGFINVNEKIVDAAVRELIEETSINISAYELRQSIINTEVFDHPLRGDRGRIITHAFHFALDRMLKLATIPEVKGGDDAAEAIWIKTSELESHEEEFYSDHLSIINKMVLGR